MAKKRSSHSRSRVRTASTGTAVRQMNPHAAGIDIGATVHFVAVPDGCDDGHVRSFETYTADLEALADWLHQCAITTVAMESTGVYWIPLYELLEQRGFDVLLAEPGQIKKVPGRKSDVLDCQWIQQLHSFGLLRASFRPSDAIVVLRAYLRQRENLVRYAGAHIQHMQKALEQMNVKLTEVLSDISGVTGMQIIEAILNGERDPATLARFRRRQCRKDEATIALALQGNWREEHLFALQQARELYLYYQRMLIEVDGQIEGYLSTFEDKSSVPLPAPTTRKKRKASKHEPRFDVQASLHRLTGLDLTAIDGIGPQAALQLIAEIGTDMTRWPTDKHFASWLSLCPGTHKTGGRHKSKSGKTRPSSNRAAHILRLSAQTLLRTDTALGAFGRRLRSRLGSPQAITAVAHKLAKIVYGMLRFGREYVDRGARYYEELHRQKCVASLHRRAQQLGFNLSPQT